jgi:undecaprenyl-phosphate 4-deoxy-4-formamido-L-arabinose transferase
VTELANGISVVIPVYNAEHSLAELMKRLQEALGDGTPFEIVAVDDGSVDGSWQVLTELAGEHPTLTAVRLLRNSGQHNALLAGIRRARYATTVTLDDDLQHPPEEIPKLLAALTDDVDLVYGIPSEPQHGLWRNLASKATKVALSASAKGKVARSVSAFRAFRTELRDAFAGYSAPDVSIDVLLTWGTSRVATVVVRHDPRQAGQSNYTFTKLVRHALTMLTGFSTWPLRLATIIGFAFTLLGMVVLVYVLVSYFAQGNEVPGFAFLASIIALFSGAQLFALGIIGEYLARMHMRSLERPPYTVRTVVPPEPPER